jgi:protein TonB
MGLRLLIGAALAITVTFALVLLMQQLIHHDYVALDDKKARKIADIQMGNTDVETKVKERKPEKPEEVDEPPPPVQQMTFDDSKMDVDSLNIAPSLKGSGDLNKGPGLSASDGEYLPMVKVQPQYPRRALSRGVEGYCIVAYTVTKTGATRDPVAIDCQPKGMFERASVKAAMKFKYKPRIENGEAIEVPNVKNKFTYKLAK